jgi:hypothetical protein
VGGEIEREVEGRDKGTGADGHALVHAAKVFRPRGDIQGQHFATQAHGFFRGDAKRVNQACGFASGVLDRLAGLNAEHHRQLLEAFLEALHAVVEDVLALIGSKHAHGLDRRHCGCNCLVDDRGRGHGDAGDHLARELVRHLQIGVGPVWLIGQIIGIRWLQHARRCSNAVGESIRSDSGTQLFDLARHNVFIIG